MDIRGEYWIVDGQVDFADGDIGDRNHESLAIDGVIGGFSDAIQSLAAEFDIESDIDGYDGYDFEQVQNILNTVQEHLMEKMTERQAIAYIMEQLGCDQEAYLVMCGFGDAREYAMKHLGWIAVRSNNVELFGYDQQRQKEIANAVYDILSSEDYQEVENINPEEVELTIDDYKTRRTWNVTLADLEQPQVAPRPAQQPTSTYNKTFTQWLKDQEENKYQQPEKSKINPWNTAAKQAGMGTELWRGTSESFKSWLHL